MEQTDQLTESEAVLRVIARESEAFWDKDYDAWADCWVQAAYVRMIGWWARGGVTITQGFDALSERIKENLRANPDPNPTAWQVRREHINLRIGQDMAWVTFDQYAQDTGEPDMDMPGVSRETRILEKHDGEWKLVYAGWLLEGER